MAKLQTIITDIKALTVIELAELVAQLQAEFGVSAASMAAPAAGQGAPTQAAEVKTSFKIELIDIGTEKIKVIKALRQVKQGLGLGDAKAAVEGEMPYLIVAEANKEESESMKKLFEEAGAKVKVS